eukprot:UN26881
MGYSRFLCHTQEVLLKKLNSMEESINKNIKIAVNDITNKLNKLELRVDQLEMTDNFQPIGDSDDAEQNELTWEDAYNTSRDRARIYCLKSLLLKNNC